MSDHSLIMVGTCDLAGQVRGKGFPASQRDARIAKGVGWCPTNAMITCFGQIVATPFGPRGDLMLIPDPDSECRVVVAEDAPVEHFFLGEIFQTDGRTPWALCPRGLLRRSVNALAAEAGLTVTAAFEHEFFYSGQTPRLGDSYSLDAVRLAGAFPERLLAALAAGGVPPDSFMAEYGPQQFEVTVDPAGPIEAADRAVKLRQLTHAVAGSLGGRVSFSPVVDRAAVGNGVHIHLGLSDLSGRPVNYDPAHPHGMSATAGKFLAGVLRHLPALCAITAPSAISYERLVPNRWSAAFTNLGYRDREASLRICPVWEVEGADPSGQYHFEYRAADAAGSPYLQLALVLHAGLQGLSDDLPMPAATTGDPAALAPDEAARLGVRRLPQSLEEALAALEADTVARSWMPEELYRAYAMHKAGELSLVRDLSSDEIARRYAECY